MQTDDQQENARGPWPGRNRPALDQVEETDDESIRIARNNLARDEPARALKILRAAGCNDEVLFDLLWRLRRAGGAEPIPKARLRSAIRRLRAAAHEIRVLGDSSLGRYIFEDLGRSSQLIEEITWVIHGAEAVQWQASGSKKPRRDELRELLTTMVREATGKPRNEEVAALIRAVEAGETYSSDAHRQWQRRQKDVDSGASE